MAEENENKNVPDPRFTGFCWQQCSSCDDVGCSNHGLPNMPVPGADEVKVEGVADGR